MSTLVSIFVTDSVIGSLLNAAMSIGFVVSLMFAVLVGLRGERTPETGPGQHLKR